MTQPNTKTPAMVLQEFTVKHGYSPPEYNLVRSKMGTHENEFYYQVSVAGIVSPGFGRSKQVAKHCAATKALDTLAEQGLYDPRSNPAQEFNAQSHRNESDSPLKAPVNYIGTLQDLCCENKLPMPVFVEISDVGPPHCREFTYECGLGSIKTQATANTKKQAKQLAARCMLDKVRNTCSDLVEQYACDSNAVLDVDQEAIGQYKEMHPNLHVTTNRAAPIEDFSNVFSKIMDEKGFKFEDFTVEFEKRDMEALDQIMERVDVSHKIDMMQSAPPIAVALFGLDTPFTLIAVGENEADAKLKVIEEVFSTLEVYMN